MFVHIFRFSFCKTVTIEEGILKNIPQCISLEIRGILNQLIGFCLSATRKPGSTLQCAPLKPCSHRQISVMRYRHITATICGCLFYSFHWSLQHTRLVPWMWDIHYLWLRVGGCYLCTYLWQPVLPSWKFEITKSKPFSLSCFLLGKPMFPRVIEERHV